MTRLRNAAGWAAAVLVSVMLSACAPLIAGYSLDAYKNATSLKAETLALVDESGESFASHTAEVKALTTKLNGAYEFARGIPKNEISAAQWRLLINPDGNLYGGFVKTWRDGSVTSATYRTEKKKQLGEAFDYIACLEVNKKESKACSSIKAGGNGQ